MAPPEPSGRIEWRRGESNPRPETLKALQGTDLCTASDRGDAECGAPDTVTPDPDAQLQQVVDAWLQLPEAVRAGITAMIRASTGSCDQ